MIAVFYMMPRCRGPAVVAVALALLLSPVRAHGQGPTPGMLVRGDVRIGDGLDRFLERAEIAASAASVVVRADGLRKGATEALRTGRRDDARKLLRQAGEMIAAAAPEGATMRNDPFLSQYLGELTGEIASLDAPFDPDVDPHSSSMARLSYGRLRGQFLGSRTRLGVHGPTMLRILREEGMPDWLLAVGLVESGYSPQARSPKGALGIWQFMPATGARFGLAQSARGDERQDPEKSTRAAARYLRQLYALFGDWSLALAAYNAGEGRVARVIRTSGVRDFETMAVRGLLPSETIEYVPRVYAAARLIGLGHPSHGARAAQIP